MRQVGQVSIGSYEHISGMVIAGHMSNEVITAPCAGGVIKPLWSEVSKLVYQCRAGCCGVC